MLRISCSLLEYLTSVYKEPKREQNNRNRRISAVEIECPQSFPGVVPLTKKPEDSGYEV